VWPLSPWSRAGKGVGRPCGIGAVRLLLSKGVSVVLRSMRRLAVGAAAMALVLSACGTGGQEQEEGGDATAPAGGEARDLNYSVIVHSVPDGSFWNVVKKGAEDAGTQYGVNVEVTGDPEGS